jgi:diguanylate cyclase (GGDEF)-like protein/PAS domain S-box-containing protein
VVITVVASYVSRTHLAVLGRSYKLITACVLGWCAVAWLSADYYHQRRSSQYVEAEKQLAQQQAQRTASNINERLQLLRGNARLGAVDTVAQRALAEFALQPLDLRLTTAQRQQRWTANKALAVVNQHFALAATQVMADQIYLLDELGNCIASSNAGKPDSFVGTNYADRDYFLQARAGQLGFQYAVGRISKVPGLFYAAPVSMHGSFFGALVVKKDVGKLAYFTNPVNAFVSDARGVIVQAPDKAFEFRALPGAAIAQIPVPQRRQLYGREAFDTLRMQPWDDAHLPGVVMLGMSSEPMVLASTPLPQDAITVHTMRPLGELARFQLERNWLFFLLAAAGSLLLMAASAVIHYLRATQLADAELRIAATAFESQQGMSIANADGVMLRVNQAFTEITGYSAEEAVGQTPTLLRSDRHDKAFFKAMWEQLATAGTWQGEIWNRRKNGEVFPEWLTLSAVKNAAGQLTHFVSIFTDISSRKLAENQIEQLAFYDPLTALPNRRLLLDRLAQALTACVRHNRRGALLYVDLDNFKTLNDTLGHAQGDLLLTQVAERLSHSVREGDTVARLGGDKFAVMLEDLNQDVFDAASQAEVVGEKIRLSLGQSYLMDGHEHHSTPSIGITLFGDDAKDARLDEPLKRAELAMYQAKAIGRNAIRFFDPQMQEKVSARAALESDLREAIANAQFVLYYQAQVVGEGRLTGVEALVRWQHPQRGLVSPAEFIPLAEESGLILPLGQWVLEAACAQLAAWAKSPDMAHLTVAVNVSARQFHQADFVSKVQAVLKQTGANPKRLKLELTESLLVDDVQGTIGKMNILKTQGVGFSLDDFGTGYSSLAYLKRLPLDQLKIDQSFVRNILTDSNDMAISKMVIVLAESLGLTVIAEGVELEAQQDALARQGCHAYQGYLFSRPLPIAEFEAYAARQATQAQPPQRAP